jgi:Fur family zinc uptake transcriptional regulator
MHTGQFLICRDCRTVTELGDPDIDKLVEEKASALGFTAVRQVLEIEGVCKVCRSMAQRA